MFCQDLRDEIDRLTSLHAAALERVQLQQRKKKRETERLFAHTDELKQRIKVSMGRRLHHITFISPFRISYGFTARRYASAVNAVVMCLSVCLSVRHKPALYQNC